MFAKLKAWFTEGLVTTQQLDRVKAEIVETAHLIHDFRAEMRTFVQDSSLQFKTIFDYSVANFSAISDKLNARGAFREELQKFIQAQYETNRDIVNAMQAVDSRVEHHIALLQGFPSDEDELPLEEKPDLADLATSLYQIRDIVEAFKANLAIQVRLSQSDYDDVLKASDARLIQLSQRIDALQNDLLEFRAEFQKATTG